MAEKQPEVVEIDYDNDDDLKIKGPTNWHLAEKYAWTLDENMAEFKDLVREDRKNVLKVTIKSFKRCMVAQFKEMKNADVEVVLHCVKDASCLAL